MPKWDSATAALLQNTALLQQCGCDLARVVEHLAAGQAAHSGAHSEASEGGCEGSGSNRGGDGTSGYGTVGLPAHWNIMVSPWQDVDLVDVGVDKSEFKEVADLFYATCSRGKWRVAKIERVQNLPQLHQCETHKRIIAARKRLAAPTRNGSSTARPRTPCPRFTGTPSTAATAARMQQSMARGSTLPRARSHRQIVPS